MTSLTGAPIGDSRKTSTAIQSRIFYGMKGFRVLQPAWLELLGDGSGHQFYHHPEWFAALLPMVPHEDFFFYAEEVNGCTTAIVPLNRGKQRIGGIPLRSIEFICNEHVPFCDYIVRNSPDALGLANRLTRALKKERIGGDLLALCNVPYEAHALQDMELTAQGIHITRQKRVCNSLRIDNYETMLAGFSENFRNNLRRARNKVGQAVDVRFEWTQDVAGLESAYERFLNVEAAGWKGEQGTSISQDPIARKFYSDLIQQLGPSGQCAIFLMTVEGKAIAGQLALLAGNTCYLLKIGYDENYKHLSPGNMLLEQLLQRLQNSNIRQVNLITGMDWHANWNPEPSPVMNHFLFNLTSRGLLAYTLHQGNSLRKQWGHDEPVESRQSLA